MHRPHALRCCVVLLCLLAAIPLRGEAPTSRAELAEQLALAHGAYDAGVEALSSDPARARRSFEEAAARYRDLAGNTGNAAPTILYNLGNAELLAGQVGRAVVAYQRGLNLAPRNNALNENLAAARARADERGAPRPPALTGIQTTHRVLSILPERVRLVLFLALLALAWALGIWRLLHEIIRPDRWVIGLVAVCGAITLATLLTDHFARTNDDRAVVISQTLTFDGLDDATFGQANPDALPAGTELRIIETRDAWSRVRLGDERETWVTTTDLERVRLPADA